MYVFGSLLNFVTRSDTDFMKLNRKVQSVHFTLGGLKFDIYKKVLGHGG